mmetsp:Transcript_22766/g.19788  ORF Transcript_22766/g.19788 Transcript_22766/m.19788 type:complete len:186 (-) Transcript_22766:201-758(-)
MKSFIAIFALIALTQATFLAPQEPAGFDPVLSALTAFYTGLSSHFSLSAPSDMMNCYNTINAVPEITFFYDWAQTVTSAGADKAENATWTYFNATGAKLYLSIPTSVIICRRHSEDYANFVKALGVDPTLTCFLDGFQDYLMHNSQDYYNSFSSMLSSFNGLNSTAAGETYGEFLENVKKVAPCS